MSQPQGETSIAILNASATAGVSVASTGDKAIFPIALPMQLIRWGLVANGTAIAADAGTIACDKQPTAGSASGRVDAYGGSITTSAGIALGQVAFYEPTTKLILSPGQQLVFEVTDAWSAGVASIFVEYRLLPFIDASETTATEYTV